MFDMFTDPTLFAGFATLVLLEVILGVDNLVFIAILADKLPPAQRDKARILGLALALGMRLVLLASISWLARLTDPLFSVFNHAFSGRHDDIARQNGDRSAVDILLHRESAQHCGQGLLGDRRRSAEVAVIGMGPAF